MPDSPAGLRTAGGDVLLMVGTTKGAFLLRSRTGERADAAVRATIVGGRIAWPPTD